MTGIKTIGIMKKSLLYVAAAIMVLACSKESIAPVVLGPQQFNARISETKVSIGEFDSGTQKATLEWTVGDKVKMVYPSGEYEFTVTSISSGEATLNGTGPDSENPTAAWYPADSYDHGTIILPAIQQYGHLPIVLEGTVSGSDITFAATNQSTVICYPLTGELTVKEAYLYLTDTPNLGLIGTQYDVATYGKECYTTAISPQYTLTLETPVALSNDPTYVCFAIPAADKVATLEVKVAAPTGALVPDYKLLRRKKTALSQTGGVVKMPTLTFTEDDTDITGQRWAFGTNHGGLTGINNRSGNGENTWAAEADYAACGLYASGNYQKLNAYFVANNLKGVIPGNHRYVAIKSDIIYAMRHPSDGSTLKADPSWDLRMPDQAGSANWSFQYLDGKKRTRISGAIDCSEENVVITYFDLMQQWNNNYYTTGQALSGKGGYFVQQIQYVNGNNVTVHPDMTCKIYWWGFFNSIEEIQAYNASLAN